MTDWSKYRAYQCPACRMDEIEPIGSRAERLGVCRECALLDLDLAPTRDERTAELIGWLLDDKPEREVEQRPAVAAT